MENINFGLDELHLIQLAMFRRLVDVCEERHLKYFLGFGSLLGAVREHKIIAWDDSIDVVMPYKDYEELTNLPQEVWGEGLFMQTYYTDPQYPKYYAKLRDSNTTLIKADYAAYDINQGIYINIMPLIRLADDQGQRRRQVKDAKLYKAITEGKPIGDEDKPMHLYSALILGTSSGQKKVHKREELKKEITKYEDKKTRECFVLAGSVSLTLALPVFWFEEAVKCDFEGMNVNIPKGWQEWLSLRYGNYMEVPISDIQGDKIASFITLNTKESYLNYKGETYCQVQ